MTTPNLFVPGSGISFFEMKLPPAIARRIEWLGRQNDRVNACLANNDTGGLMQLAAEYAEKGMLRTANKVMGLIAKQEPR